MAWSYEQAEGHVLDLEMFGMRFGTERMLALLDALGSPQNAFEAVHVVGSNGKSSTVRMTAAILRAHGARVGAYTSPHLIGFEERVQVDGTDVTRAAFARAVELVADAARRVEAGREPEDRVTQFEMLTAAAFVLLGEAGVELAVIEAGLGGRHDSTNVLSRSRVQVLTNVSLEHTRWLGSTIEAIAGEKLEVVREGATLVVGHGLHPDALALARAICAARSARLVIAPEATKRSLRATGAFQRRNFALAEAAARAQLGGIDDAAADAAGAVVIVPGRFEMRPADDGEATVVLDGAHNPDGAAALVTALAEAFPGRRAVAVLSVLEDKDAGAIVRALLPVCDRFVCTRCANPRALTGSELSSIAEAEGAEALVEEDPRRALVLARELAGPEGLALATGSIYLLADLSRGAPADRVSRL